jgi:hypothetical protein
MARVTDWLIIIVLAVPSLLGFGLGYLCGFLMQNFWDGYHEGQAGAWKDIETTEYYRQPPLNLPSNGEKQCKQP